MRRSTACALAGILLLALFLRLLPLTRFLYWGADFGEYHRITSQLLADGYVSLDYRGWGTAYPYFPGMHVVQAAGVAAGLSPLAAEVLLVPALASASVLLAFLIAVRITRDDRVGLVAAAFLAVALPHVYTTAHAIPASLGDLFFATGLLGLLGMRRDARWLLVLVPITAALVVTHHLSAYFLIVAAALAFLLRIAVAARATPCTWRREAAYLTFLVAASTAYWTFYATPFQRQIFPQVQFVPWWLLLGAFVGALPVLYGVHVLRPRWRWRYRPRYPSRARAVRLLAIGTAAVFGFLAAVLVVGVPGTTIRLPWEVVPAVAALLVLFAFSAAGRRYADFHESGVDVTGWFLAFGLSAALGTVLASTVLVPYRHMQVLMWPVAVFAGLGAVSILGVRTSGRGKLAAAGIVSLLLAGSIPVAYPPRALMAGHQEGIPEEALSSATWLDTSAWGLVGSDHMGSMEAFGFGGRDAVWDYAPEILRADSFAEARGVFAAAPFPAGTAPVRFVLLNDDIAAGAMLLPWEPASPMTATQVGKFDLAPFQKVYDDGYARVYYLNWGLT